MLEKLIIKMLLLLKVIRATIFAKSTRAFYDQISTIYDKIFTSHIIHVENIVNLLISIYPMKNKAILDLGCGTGMLSKALANKGFRVISTDISFESLRVLKKTDPRVSLIQGDAESLALSDHSFKVLVCLGVWRHFTNLEVILDEICRVLSRDAIFILGYFPPKLGGVFHVPENYFGRIMTLLYNTMVNWLGYNDQVDINFEHKTLRAIGERFAQIRKIDSGHHWYLILATNPQFHY